MNIDTIIRARAIADVRGIWRNVHQTAGIIGVASAL